MASLNLLGETWIRANAILALRDVQHVGQADPGRFLSEPVPAGGNGADLPVSMLAWHNSRAVGGVPALVGGSAGLNLSQHGPLEVSEPVFPSGGVGEPVRSEERLC